MRAVKVDALELARAVNRWRPRGVSVELASEDRLGLCEQLAEHLAAELGLEGDVADRFVSIAGSPFYSSRPGEDDEKPAEVSS